MRQVDPAPFDKKSKDTTTSCECDITQPDKRGGVEAEVQKKLGELNVPIAQNQGYKDFVRSPRTYFYWGLMNQSQNKCWSKIPLEIGEG